LPSRRTSLTSSAGTVSLLRPCLAMPRRAKAFAPRPSGLPFLLWGPCAPESSAGCGCPRLRHLGAPSAPPSPPWSFIRAPRTGVAIELVPQVGMVLSLLLRTPGGSFRPPHPLVRRIAERSSTAPSACFGCCALACLCDLARKIQPATALEEQPPKRRTMPTLSQRSSQQTGSVSTPCCPSRRAWFRRGSWGGPLALRRRASEALHYPCGRGHADNRPLGGISVPDLVADWENGRKTALRPGATSLGRP